MDETLSSYTNFIPELIDKSYTFNESGEFSIACVGDLHLHSSTFRSRIDDYPETTLLKLSILRRELVSRGIKYLICPGDIFHLPKEKVEYEYAVIEEFLKFKEAGITVFSIVGNHDIAFTRLENISKSSLGILFVTKTINPFTKITFKRGDRSPLVLTGCNYPNEPCPPEDKSAFNICVAHKFYNQDYDDTNLTHDDLESLGYNMFILGHDHVPYDFTKVPISTGVVGIVRTGSFTRGTSHSYNTNRMVYMDEIKVGNKVEVVRHTLPVKPPEAIFPTSVMDKEETLNLDKVSKELADLVTRLYSENNVQGCSVYDVLDNSPVEPVVKDRITSYLEMKGIFRVNNSLEVGGN